jgi:leucyl/phenylalanyl-tRNA--protein transferase
VIPRIGASAEAPFPQPCEALENPDGLLAWGGGLEPQRLLRAYQNGIFPWYSEHEPILWWSPSRRCVIPTRELHISRRLRRLLRQHCLSTTMDSCFAGVIAACSSAHGATWISPEMRTAYLRLHELGHAHSLEVWREGELVGGLYGVATGPVFAGESMFSGVRDASKVALAYVCRVLSDWGYAWLDAQLYTPHLASMGAIEIRRDAYLRLLRRGPSPLARVGNWQQRYAGHQRSAANW